MASFGANYPVFCKDGSNLGIVLGKLVAANLTVNLASGELYADDGLAEQASEFASGSIAMETDDLTDDVAGEIYGCEVSGGEVTYNKGDSAPRGKLAYYKALMRNGVKLFKAYCYPQVSAALGNDNAQTKGSSITFSTSATTFTVFADENGDWRITKEFNSAADAKAYINNFCNKGVSYKVDLSVQGAEGNEKAVKSAGYVAAGGSATITITGTPTKVYDNGTDKTTAVSSGVYTISSIAADHTVAVIF